ncbi:hypothetical protein AWH67_00220 [Bartonella bacilliformis]|nr:hypothetical protein AWH67_00220 [Bartonella bacilliformis]
MSKSEPRMTGKPRGKKRPRRRGEPRKKTRGASGRERKRELTRRGGGLRMEGGAKSGSKLK